MKEKLSRRQFGKAVAFTALGLSPIARAIAQEKPKPLAESGDEKMLREAKKSLLDLSEQRRKVKLVDGSEPVTLFKAEVKI